MLPGNKRLRQHDRHNRRGSLIDIGLIVRNGGCHVWRGIEVVFAIPLALAVQTAANWQKAVHEQHISWCDVSKGWLTFVDADHWTPTRLPFYMDEACIL
jgi:hypothetical protein